jgi:predicted phosphodiesterase
VSPGGARSRPGGSAPRGAVRSASRPAAPLRVGLVSDTHGHLDPRLADLFAGCDVAALGAVAPVTAVRGNNDEGTALALLPETALVPLGALTALVVHDLGRREDPGPPARAILARRRPEIVVHGHSHRPGALVVGGTLFVNPGSAGPRRFSLPRAAGILAVAGRTARVELYDLAPRSPVPLGAPLEAEL